MAVDLDLLPALQHTLAIQRAAAADRVVYLQVSMVTDRVRINLPTSSRRTFHLRSTIRRLIKVPLEHISSNRQEFKNLWSFDLCSNATPSDRIITASIIWVRRQIPTAKRHSRQVSTITRLLSTIITISWPASVVHRKSSSDCRVVRIATQWTWCKDATWSVLLNFSREFNNSPKLRESGS